MKFNSLIYETLELQIVNGKVSYVTALPTTSLAKPIQLKPFIPNIGTTYPQLTPGDIRTYNLIFGDNALGSVKKALNTTIIPDGIYVIGFGTQGLQVTKK
jgi:hypothetical protein